MRWLLCFILFSHSVFALKIDPNSSSYNLREPKRVEEFDFSGEFPNLFDIDIDAKRKKHVSLLLGGTYPVLKKICFEGGFGIINGDLTGDFPEVREVNISCTNALLELDLDGKFSPECEILISGKEDIILNLPKEKAVIVAVTASPLGKIVNNHPSLTFKKKRITQKILATPEAKEDQPLRISITAFKGTITLN